MKRSSRGARSKLSRRGFLRGSALGAAAATLPFSRLLSSAHAQEDTPKRFIALFSPCGTVFDEWVPSGGERDFTFKRILEPLEPFREKLLVLDGLNMQIPGAAGGHQAGIGALLTGAGLQDGDFCGGNNCSSQSGWPAHHSIDQEIARTLDGVTPFSSLELGVRVRSGNQRRHLSYRAIDDPLPHLDDPYEVFDLVFGDLDPGADEAARERRRREQRSVLDSISGDIHSLRARLGVEHRSRLDAHLESLRDAERRFESGMEGSVLCEPPTLGARMDPSAESNYPEMTLLQLDILTAALACDRTRVATFLWSGATSGQRFPWLGLPEVRDDNGNPTTSHHSFSHVSDVAHDQLVEINRWYAEQVAYLLAKLDSLPEPNGDGTLLDNSVIFWGNELSDGDRHLRREMKFIVAGSGGGYFDTGRYLTFDDDDRHNDLLVSFANAMGHGIDTFGEADYCNGPLDVLR